MNTTVFILGSHPALSAAELAASAERWGLKPSWDPSRLPAALLAFGDFPAPSEMQRDLGGTMMIGTLRATFSKLPGSAEILAALPEILEVRNGKRLVGLSALPCNTNIGSLRSDLAGRVRHLAMELKRAMGMKGTRIVFPPARNASRSDAGGSARPAGRPVQRPDLSTAQLLHNNLPNNGTAIVFLVEQGRVDLVTVQSIQDIQAYAQRDRGRPHADPGRGMLPPKVAQMMINLSLVPARGTVYDPFCGVGTIPMEAALMGLAVVASDASSKQVERTRENLSWLLSQSQSAPSRRSAIIHDSIIAGVRLGQELRVFVHDVTRGSPPVSPQSVDAIVTEGWLGPPRTTSPLPKEAEEIFSRVAEILKRLLKSADAVVRPGGRVVMSVPSFRVRKRLARFPFQDIRAHGWTRESLVPPQWTEHPLFREAGSGTLLYGRPDAVVLREIVRFRKG